VPGGIHPNREGGNQWTFVAVHPSATVAAQMASVTAKGKEGRALAVGRAAIRTPGACHASRPAAIVPSLRRPR
jgi:hypothetical protein